MTTAKSLLISLTIGGGLLAHAAAAPGIVPPGSKVELVARTQAAQAAPFTEGPAYRDGHIYFTDTSNSRILRVRVDRQAALPLPLEIFREPTGVPMDWSLTQRADCWHAKAVAATGGAGSRELKRTVL